MKKRFMSLESASHILCISLSVQSVVFDIAGCDSGLKDLKELHLDRTLITDEGAAIVKGVTFY